MMPKNRPFTPYLDSHLYRSIADFATYHGLEMPTQLKRELAAFAETVERVHDLKLRETMMTNSRCGSVVLENGRLVPITPAPMHDLSETEFKALHHRNSNV